MRSLYLDQNATKSRITKKSVEVLIYLRRFYSRVFVTRKNYTEGFLPLYTTQLGGEYYVSTFCEFGGICQFSITALGSRTHVSLEIPDSVPEITFCVGDTLFRSKRDTNLTLNRWEVLQIESANDLTGTHIVTDRDVVVMAGARDMNVSGTIVHVVEQLVPVELWGQNFIVKSMEINPCGDIIQITSSMHNTRITMSDFPVIILAEPGKTIRRHLDYGTTSTISSNHPIQVVQMSGFTYNTSTDMSIAPGMSVVPAIEQYEYLCSMTSDTANIMSPSSISVPSNYYMTVPVSDITASSIPYSGYLLNSVNNTNLSSQVLQIKSKYKLEAFGGIERSVESGTIMPMCLAEKVSCFCIYTIPSGHTTLKQRWFNAFNQRCFNVVCLLGYWACANKIAHRGVCRSGKSYCSWPE